MSISRAKRLISHLTLSSHVKHWGSLYFLLLYESEIMFSPQYLPTHSPRSLKIDSVFPAFSVIFAVMYTNHKDANYVWGTTLKYSSFPLPCIFIEWESNFISPISLLYRHYHYFTIISSPLLISPCILHCGIPKRVLHIQT